MSRPQALDICTGLGGWSQGLIAEGWHVTGIDIEDMFAALNEPRPDHFDLVLSDIRDVKGADYAHVRLIVGSSPCPDFSWRAMPWTKARKATGPFLGIKLFWEQFRIQREICEAAGRYVPMVVENVRGAIPWVGPSAYNSGSMHFWGDVPVLMPAYRHIKVKAFRFDGSGRSFQSAAVREHADAGGFRPTSSLAWDNESRWFNDGPRSPDSISSSSSSSPARKAASARIAKIPFEISSWIGACFLPT